MRQGEYSKISFSFFKKTIWGESKWSAAWFQYVSIALNLTCNEEKLQKTLHYWFRDKLKFDCLEKGLGIVSPPYFVDDFLRKVFVMLYSSNWANFIVWLPLLLEILGNVFQLFAFQVVMSLILKLTYLSNQAVFLHDQKFIKI